MFPLSVPLPTFPIPGRNETLPDSEDEDANQVQDSQFPHSAPDPVGEEHETVSVMSSAPPRAAPRRWQPAGNSSRQTRFQWEPQSVSLLLEQKQLEAEENKTLQGQEHIITSDQRRAKLQREWEADIADDWYQLLDSFYSQRATMRPPCMTESITEQTAAAKDIEQALTDQQTEVDDEPQTTTDPTIRHNSGKRRKDVSKSAVAIVDALTTFSSSFIQVVERMEERDLERQRRAEECELKRLRIYEQAEECRERATAERNSKYLEALGSLTAEGSLDLVMMMAAVLLLVNETLDDEDINPFQIHSEHSIQVEESATSRLWVVAVNLASGVLASSMLSEGL
ncbi:hypothetical protein R1sor_001182 [Riccia sorocarpa]|uniref:Uncharacterized protein n=1 Tax=Riccia sorocarpa TaxID=122646 RepID=A0ABD3GV81_9MARC